MWDYLLLVYRNRIRQYVRDERGSMAIEYIGLAILALAILGLLTSYLSPEKGGEIGNAFVQKIKGLITDVGSSKQSTPAQ